MCHEAFRELEAAVLDTADAYEAGLAYLGFAVAHPRRYRVMFGAADLSEPAWRLFTQVLSDPRPRHDVLAGLALVAAAALFVPGAGFFGVLAVLGGAAYLLAAFLERHRLAA